MATGRSVTAVMTLIVLFTGRQPLAAQDDSTAIVLDVHNYAKVPPSLLQDAEGEASRVYAATGVRIVWRHDGAEGPAPSARRPSARDRDRTLAPIPPG